MGRATSSGAKISFSFLLRRKSNLFAGKCIFHLPETFPRTLHGPRAEAVRTSMILCIRLIFSSVNHRSAPLATELCSILPCWALLASRASICPDLRIRTKSCFFVVVVIIFVVAPGTEIGGTTSTILCTMWKKEESKRNFFLAVQECNRHGRVGRGEPELRRAQRIKFYCEDEREKIVTSFRRDCSDLIQTGLLETPPAC